MTNIINFGELKISRGSHKHCSHKNLVYDPKERVIQCSDCERYLDAFDVFLNFIHQFDRAYAKLNRDREELAYLQEKGLSLKAAKMAEQAWRSKTNTPICPHCFEGIFPEDKFGNMTINKDIAIKRRTDKEKSKEKQDDLS